MQILGFAMLAAFFVGLHFFIAQAAGHLETLKMWCVVIPITAFIAVGSFLAQGGEL